MVRADKKVFSRTVRSGTGYLSQDDLRQHFGLGAAARVDSVEVHWPDGESTELGPQEVGRPLRVVQPEKRSGDRAAPDPAPAGDGLPRAAQ